MHYVLDIVPIIVIALFVYLGKADGLLKSIIAVVGYAMTIAFSFSVSEFVANRVYNDYLKVAINQSLEENKLTFLSQDFVDAIFKPASVSVVKLFVMILSVVIMFFVVRLLSKFLSKILSKTFLNGPNKFLGALFGAVKGVIVVSLLIGLAIVIVPIVSEDSQIFAQSTVNKTYLFKYFYDFVNTLI